MEKISPSHSFTQKTVSHGTAAVLVGYSETTDSAWAFAYGATLWESKFFFANLHERAALMAEAAVPLLIKIFNVIRKNMLSSLIQQFWSKNKLVQ